VIRIEEVVIRKIVTIPADSTVEEAIEKMDDQSTSCLAVLSEGSVYGIITVQDLVYRVVAKGLDPKNTRVQHIVSRPVIMMRPENSLGWAIKVMLQRKVKKIPLISGEGEYGRLIGLVSFSDIVKYHSELFTSLWEQIFLTVPASCIEGNICIV